MEETGGRVVALTMSDLLTAAAACRDALTPALTDDWTVLAGDLEWDCRRTLDHISGALLVYATHLANRATQRLPRFRKENRDSPVADLLAAVPMMACVLVEVIKAAPPGTRAYHSAGMADVSGFIAMGCSETLIHTNDIALGLNRPFRPLDDLCRRVAVRLFPWAPTDVGGWSALRWGNGRIALPGRDRLGPDWSWHCAPLEEWDGAIKKVRPASV